MRILITGSNGFIGRNLISQLKNDGYDNLFLFDSASSIIDLETYCENCDFVFHLAGTNRPSHIDEFMKGNFELTSTLIKFLEKKNNYCPIMLSSSIQANLNNPYGESKKASEDALLNYSIMHNVPVYIYRFPNVFGKWSKPNYNSVIATFCYNISRDLEITVNNPETVLSLVYIDDVIQSLIDLLQNKALCSNDYCFVEPIYSIKLGYIADKIKEFKLSRENNFIIDMKDNFDKKLYSTYLSYLPTEQFSYPLKMNIDSRGSFTEVLKTENFGQVSINISKPGIVKGNHWHHTKNEKFLVVSGKAVIRFRKINENKIIEYFVSADKLEVVDIPCGYTHNIENIGDVDLVTLMWANELLNPNKQDTYFLEV